MTADVDYYDVQAMIRDARSEIRAEINNAVQDATRQLREELNERLRGVFDELSRVGSAA